MFDWLVHLVDSVWDILQPLIAPAAAVAAAAFVVWGLRRSILWLRGRSPRVQITQFGWAAAAEGEREAVWVTSLFREELKALRLDGLDAVPDRAPGAPLVEIVEGVGQGVSHGLDVGKAIGRFWRAAVPDSAYEVWATLRPLEDGGRISIQLIERAGGNRTLVSFTTKGPSWETSAREAAMAVAGALYPRVASRHKGPWTEWREAVPAGLIGLYQGALKCEREDRLEQALGGFRTTMRMDPLNPHLRLKVAMLEERLELHLDAWFTYRAIVAEDDRRLWRGRDRRIRLLALYRLAIHLWNRPVAAQWVEGARRRKLDEHDKSLGKLRAELTTALRRDPLLLGTGTGAAAGAVEASAAELMDALAASRNVDRAGLLDPFQRRDSSAERIEEIHEVLQIVSLRNLEEMKSRMRVWPPWSSPCWPSRASRLPPLRRWLRRREFSPQGVEVSERLVRMRIAAGIERRLGAAASDDLKEDHDRLMEVWPFPPEVDGEEPDTGMRLKLWWGDRRDDAWQLHFNAACTIASTLLEGSLLHERCDCEGDDCEHRDRGARYAQAAVQQLEEYAHLARSGRVAGKADWLAFEDPDLAALVVRPEFRLWASQHLAFELPEDRPTRAVDVERYTVLMVKRGAEALAKSWRQRAGADPVPAEKLIGWWREEEEIWTRIESACRDHRSWRRRLEALEALERWNAANGLAAVDLAHEKRDGSVTPKRVPEKLFEKLAMRIKRGDGNGNGAVLEWVEARVTKVEKDRDDRLRGHGGARPIALSEGERAAAIKAAQIWSRLDEELGAVLEGTGPETAAEFGSKPNWRRLTALVKG